MRAAGKIPFTAMDKGPRWLWELPVPGCSSRMVSKQDPLRAAGNIPAAAQDKPLRGFGNQRYRCVAAGPCRCENQS